MFAPLSPVETAMIEDRPKAKTKTPIVPVPADAPVLNFKHPKHGAPSRSWPWHDAAGCLIGFTSRFDFRRGDGTSGKDVMPVMYCDLGGGRRAWRAHGFPEPRPLYRLTSIVADKAATVIVCEGEKAADAAAELFPAFIATTPVGGSKAPHKSDWSHVAGRRVIIATDHDAPGESFGDAVCELARKAGATEVLQLRPDRLGAWVWIDGQRVAREGEIPDGYDLADALADGWTAERVATMRDDPSFLIPYRDAAEREAIEASFSGKPAQKKQPSGWPFRVVENGVERRIEKEDRETGEVTVEWRWFCSRLEVVAETRSADGEDWGRLLRITDRDERVKSWAMPMAMLAGDGTSYRERLLSLGLTMSPGKNAKDWLHEYISTARPKAKARCVSRVGWHGRSFVFHHETLGSTDE